MGSGSPVILQYQAGNTYILFFFGINSWQSCLYSFPAVRIPGQLK